MSGSWTVTSAPEASRNPSSTFEPSFATRHIVSWLLHIFTTAYVLCLVFRFRHIRYILMNITKGRQPDNLTPILKSSLVAANEPRHEEKALQLGMLCFTKRCVHDRRGTSQLRREVAAGRSTRRHDDNGTADVAEADGARACLQTRGFYLTIAPLRADCSAGRRDRRDQTRAAMRNKRIAVTGRDTIPRPLYLSPTIARLPGRRCVPTRANSRGSPF
jgi:hypothetical protein